MSSLHLDLQTFPSFYYTQRVTRTSLSKRKSNFRTDLIIEMCKISTPLPKLDRTSFIRKSMNLQTSFKNYQNIKNIYNNNSNFSFSSFFKSYIYFFTLKKIYHEYGNILKRITTLTRLCEFEVCIIRL